MRVLLRKKSSFKMLGLTVSSKIDWESYVISNVKTTSKKIGALICSMKFLSPASLESWVHHQIVASLSLFL